MPAHPYEAPATVDRDGAQPIDAHEPGVHRWDSPEDYPTWDRYFLIRWALAPVVLLGFGVIVLLGL